MTQSKVRGFTQLENGGSFQFVLGMFTISGKPPFSYGFPMVFLWFTLQLYPLGKGPPATTTAGLPGPRLALDPAGDCSGWTDVFSVNLIWNQRPIFLGGKKLTIEIYIDLWSVLIYIWTIYNHLIICNYFDNFHEFTTWRVEAINLPRLALAAKSSCKCEFPKCRLIPQVCKLCLTPVCCKSK